MNAITEIAFKGWQLHLWQRTARRQNCTIHQLKECLHGSLQKLEGLESVLKGVLVTSFVVRLTPFFTLTTSYSCEQSVSASATEKMMSIIDRQATIDIPKGSSDYNKNLCY